LPSDGSGEAVSDSGDTAGSTLTRGATESRRGGVFTRMSLCLAFTGEAPGERSALPLLRGEPLPLPTAASIRSGRLIRIGGGVECR
jgi:hypothetical protein